MDKSKFIKYSRNFIFFVGLIALTFWIILKDQDSGVLWQTIKNSDWKYFGLGILTMSVFLCMEAINIGRMLKHLGEKSTFMRNLKYALIGFFFSAITPAASGGQPMQIYYMHKDGISAGSSALTLLANITCVLFVTITLSLFNLIFNYQYMTFGLAVFFAFGTFINACAIVLFMVAIFSEKTLDKMINFVFKLIRKHADRKIRRAQKLGLSNSEQIINKAKEKCESRINKLQEQANKYKEDAKLIKQNKGIIVRTLIIYYFQYTLYYLISYWAYRAVGLNEQSWFAITSLQSIVYATVSGIPSPGAVGVSEAAYIGLFKSIIPEHLISSITLLVRCMNFYIFVLISGIVVIFTVFKSNNKKAQE